MDTWHKILNSVIADTVRCEKPPKDIATGTDGNPVWRIEVREPEPVYDTVTQTLAGPVKTIRPTEVNYAWQVEEKPVEQARTDGCAKVNSDRDQWEQSGFVYDGKAYQSDYISTQRIQLTMERARVTEEAAPGTFSTVWHTVDNQPITHNYASFSAMHTAMSNYYESCFAHANAAKQQISTSDNVQIRSILDGLSAPSKTRRR